MWGGGVLAEGKTAAGEKLDRKLENRLLETEEG